MTRLEVKRARHAARLLMKRYHYDHQKYTALRSEKHKICRSLRAEFRALMKDSVARLRNSLTSWGDTRKTASQKALSYAEGFQEGNRVTEELQRQTTASAAAARERRTLDVKPSERPSWEFKQ